MNKYKILVQGKNPYYFFRLLLNSNIKYLNLEIKEKEMYLIVDAENYKKIKKIKTSYKIKLIKIYGPRKVYQFLEANKYQILFFLIGIAINIFLSRMIFNIEIIHPDNNLKKIILEDLKLYGIDKYNFKKSYDKRREIIKKILYKERKYIDWLEIEEYGTKYIIKLEARKMNPNDKKDIKRNIIAKKNAMIIEIQAEEGEILKKKNDYVLKGEKIISGEIHNKEKIVALKKASGKVYGETWYKVTMELPEKKESKVKTDRYDYNIEIKFLNHTIRNKISYNNYIKGRKIIVASHLLPISISLNKYFETKKIYTKYNDKKIETKIMNIAEKNLRSKLTKDDTILSKKVLKKELINSKIIIEIFFKVKENITSYEIIKDEEGEIE